MTRTKHGWHIPGSPAETRRPPLSQCGGPGLCGRCSNEAISWQTEFLKPKVFDEPIDDLTRTLWGEGYTLEEIKKFVRVVHGAGIEFIRKKTE